MAKSNAMKKRLKKLREQGKDVTNSRGQVNFSTHERVTKTKRESQEKIYSKNKRHFHDEETNSSGNAFYFLDKTTIVKRIKIVPSQSIQPNETPRKSTAVIAAESGSVQASKLVSVADKYFKLSK